MFDDSFSDAKYRFLGELLACFSYAFCWSKLLNRNFNFRSATLFEPASRLGAVHLGNGARRDWLDVYRGEQVRPVLAVRRSEDVLHLFGLELELRRGERMCFTISV